MHSPAVVPKSKPRRLIALSYNYSDSDNEETREERKARIVRTYRFIVICVWWLGILALLCPLWKRNLLIIY